MLFFSLLLSSLLKIFISILFWPLLIFYTRHFLHFLQSIVSCLLSLNFVFLLKLKFSLFSCFISIYISPYTKLIFFITYSSFSWSSFFIKILKKVNGEIVAYNFYVLHENVFLQHSFFKKDSAIVYHLFFLLCICVNSIPVYLLFNSVQFSHSVMSDSSWPHGPQHTRPHCPSPTPRVHSNSCPLSQWWHPTISSSTIPFSSCLQSFPASGFFQMSQLFTSVGQSIGVLASTSVLPMNTQDWSVLRCTVWISLEFEGLSRVFSNTTVQKHQFFSAQLSLLLVS